ncbi:hypothetical protein CN533_25845 [Priestia megaterium]|uniref:hypothetical protein n=1 Tax=Priestia megaterium TaxID=1404 RepID=UPI000BF9A855|nr:hypothetical protein [Priestia megaterium]PET68583.1 hypothetical protein CN533_25845 [Priestia megaterium]PFK84476.1 hypothetical protein COJ19_21225 [Priestia megaterium]
MDISKGLVTQNAFQVIQQIEETFDELTRWSDDDYNKFSDLLHDLKVSRGEETPRNQSDVTFDTTKSVGDALEDLVNFIIKKTFFFEVTANVRTGTNEVDQVIRLSKKGKIALEKFEIPRSMLYIEEDIFLGECKNYATSLSVTYIGKFYSLLKQCDCSVGIIFTYKGISGKEKTWSDAHGLAKVIRLIEKYSNNNKKFYILEFNLKDYEDILNKKSFFDLLDAKITSLQIAANHEAFLEEPLPEQLNALIDHCKE